MFDLIVDLYQQRRIREVADAASESRRTAMDAHNEIAWLRQAVEKLALTNMALWELLRERTGLTDDQLNARIQEIDLRDGMLDGRVGGTRVLKCEECGKSISGRHGRCLYCGARAAGKPFDVR